ncbi:hypothetical protein [Aeromicrobium sp.]|uniref:hypothetical protein n=1 Tax=Aeromicrobium sp. TaxID=1871063 RepID=UPI003C4A00A3
MNRRLLALAGLLVALAVSVWAGTEVRQHLEGPGPIQTVRAATTAYATGDCQALRDISARPKAVDCAAVTQVQQAYQDEGLEPARFTYTLARRSGDAATVRVTYRKGGTPLDEMVPVEKNDGRWKIAEVSSSIG